MSGCSASGDIGRGLGILLSLLDLPLVLDWMGRMLDVGQASGDAIKSDSLRGILSFFPLAPLSQSGVCSVSGCSAKVGELAGEGVGVSA